MGSPIGLQDFPMNTQTLFMQLECFTVPDSEIRYKWSGDNPFQFNQALSLPDFKFDKNDMKLSTCHKKYESGTYSQDCPKQYD